jgi:hypothetical protein
MPTNLTEFDGECYATAYTLQGSRIVILGTHRSDRRGVRAWLAAAGHPRSGAYLTPAPGTPPGFYVKPYVADVYYRIDPETGGAVWDGRTKFGNPITVTERVGFGGKSVPPVGAGGRVADRRRSDPDRTLGVKSGSTASGLPTRPSPGLRPQHRGTVMRYTGIALILMGLGIGLYSGVSGAMTSDGVPGGQVLMGVVALGSLLGGAAVVVFGGRGYSWTKAASA